MTDRDFSIGSKNFKLSKIDAFKQFHIVRRLGPILGDIIPVAQKLKGQAGSEKSQEEILQNIAELAGPVMTGLAKLSDEDANLVLLGLCSAVEIHQPATNNWARVAKNGQLMFQDLELPELLQIAGRSFAYNLSGFFVSARQTSLGG